MPNWCENTLTIKGKETDIDDFQFVVDEKHFLNKFLPLPAELKDTVSPRDVPDKELKKKYGADNWYDWQMINWGTKWDVEIHSAIKEPKKTIYYFDSPWGPPIIGIIKISKLFPKLTFSINFNEPGMRFKGVTTIIDGEIIKDTTRDY